MARAPEGGLRPWGFLTWCVVGSCAVHGVAYAALGGLDARLDNLSKPSCEVSFQVVSTPLPAPLPNTPPALPAAPPAPLVRPQLREKPRLVAHAAVAPEAPPEAAPPPLQTLGVSEAAGLAVAGQVGTQGSTGPGSLTGQREGVIGGTGSAPAPVGPSIDLRKLTSAWASQVSHAIGTRAVHDYPRSALRARVQGTVLLTVRVGTDGRIEAVDVARSSGFPQLDEAALAAARGLSEVPAPPTALHRYLRPFPVPVNYVISG